MKTVFSKNHTELPYNPIPQIPQKQQHGLRQVLVHAMLTAAVFTGAKGILQKTQLTLLTALIQMIQTDFLRAKIIHPRRYRSCNVAQGICKTKEDACLPASQQGKHQIWGPHPRASWDSRAAPESLHRPSVE